MIDYNIFCKKLQILICKIEKIIRVKGGIKLEK